MTIPDHLLLCLSEECAEVAQRVSKALRFTLDEIQPGQEKTNAERIAEEMDDLFAVYEMLNEKGILRHSITERRELKMIKLEKFMAYSQEMGVLE